MEEKQEYEVKQVKKDNKEDKAKLLLVDEILRDFAMEEWQIRAFLQFTGWVQGKQVTRQDFITKWNEFAKKYLGGKQ